MVHYERAPSGLVDKLRQCMDQYHTRLSDCELRVDLLLAFRGEADEWACKAHGYGALATIRKTNLKDRVKGLGDVEIVLDGDHYEEWSERELFALFDHELTHVDLVIDKKTGDLKRDDHGRPVVSIRLHDRQMGWFDEVARRWGSDSAEVQQCKQLMHDWEFVQTYLPGFDPADLGKFKDEGDFQNASSDQAGR